MTNTDFEFTEAFLVKEVLGDGSPSPAAGISSADFSRELSELDFDLAPPGIVWLVEPKRSTVVERWSGTLQHPNFPNNKYGQTMSAFAHFTWIYSVKSMILVDLQSW